MSTSYYLAQKYECISFGGLMGSFSPLSDDTYKAMALRDRIFTKLSQKYPGPIYRNAINLMWYFILKQPKLFLKYMHQSMGKDDQKLFEIIPDAQHILLEMIHQTITNDTNGLCEELQFQLSSNWGFNVSDIGNDIKMFIFHGKTDQFVPVELAKDLETKLKNYEATYWKQGHMFPINPKYQEIM